MRFLLLSQYYAPEGGSAALRMTEIAEYLAGRGHRVAVVTGFPNYPEGKVFDGYRRSAIARERRRGVEVVRTFLFVTPERRAFGPRLANYLSFMLTSVYGGLLAGKPDLVYFYSPPIFLGLPAWLLGRRAGAPTVVEINDLWPMAPVSLKVVRSPLLVRAAESYERQLYRRTDRLFFYSETMRDTVVARGGIPRGKTELFPLWVSTSLFAPRGEEVRARVRRELGVGGNFVVMYTGNLGLAQGMGVLLRAAQETKDERLRYVLVGGGSEEGALRQEAAARGLRNVVFVPQQPLEKVVDYTTAADALFAHLSPAPHRLGTIPAKVLTYMSAGVASIVAARGETQRLVERSGAGLAIEPESPGAIVEAAVRLAGDPALRARMGEQGRAFAVENFERETLLARLEARLVELARAAKGGGA